jgi:hypothetical protein
MAWPRCLTVTRLTYIKEFGPDEANFICVCVVLRATKSMSETSENHVEYRGYSLDVVQWAGGHVRVSPGPQFLRIQPD